MSILAKIKEPKSVVDALCDPKWKLAMDKEMEASINSNTLVLTKLPIDRKPIGCKWIF